MQYIALRQTLEEADVSLDRLKNKYGFQEINAMKKGYDEDLKYLKDILLTLQAKNMRTYISLGSLGLSAGLGMYDFADMFFFRNRNFYLTEGLYEIKRLTVNDVKNGIVGICKEPKQNKAKMGMFLCGGIGLWLGTQNFMLKRKKEKLECIVKNLDFSELLKDKGKVSAQIEKNREAFGKKKNVDEIKEK